MDKSARDKLQENGVSIELIETLERDFKETFTQVLSDYDIEKGVDYNSDTLSLAVEVFFEVIYDLGTSDELDHSLTEYAEEVASDTGQAERYNVHFICGRAASEYPNTTLGEISMQLRGATLRENYET